MEKKSEKTKWPQSMVEINILSPKEVEICLLGRENIFTAYTAEVKK